jgi:hypothetical protein
LRNPKLLLTLPVFASAHRHKTILQSKCFEGQELPATFNHRLLDENHWTEEFAVA